MGATRDPQLWIFLGMVAAVWCAVIAMAWLALSSGIQRLRGTPEQGTKQEKRPQPDAPPTPRKAAGAVAVPDYGAFVEAQRPALDWLAEANDMPNVNPHIAAIGPSRSGKSTLVLALLTRRPGHIVITTPKSAADDAWGGFPAVRSTFGADYEPSYANIGNAWRAVFSEMGRRHADPTAPRTPLTLVVDEFTTSLDELRAIDPQRMFIRMWLMGASVGVRVIVMDPTMNVKGWGIEGRGDVRESIVFIRTDRDKSAHFFEWDAARNVAHNKRPFDTSDVPTLAAAGLDPARLWVPTMPLPATQPTPGAAQFAAPTSRETTPHEEQLIREWHGAGLSGREMARRLYRERGGDNANYTGDGAPFDAVKAVIE